MEDQIKNDISQLIGQDKLSEALQAIEQNFETDNTLLQLMARLNHYNQQKMSGVLDNATETTQKNRIRVDILSYLNSLTTAQFNPSQDSKDSSANSNRTVNQSGQKSIYIERNEGNININ